MVIFSSGSTRTTKNNLTTVEIIENESNFERENTKILTQNFQALEEALRILNAVSKAEIRKFNLKLLRAHGGCLGGKSR